MSFSRFWTLSRYSSKFGEFDQLFLGYFAPTLRAVLSSLRRSAATVTDSLREWRILDVQDKFLSPSFASSALTETRGQCVVLTGGLAYRIPESLRDPLSPRRN